MFFSSQFFTCCLTYYQAFESMTGTYLDLDYTWSKCSELLTYLLTHLVGGLVQNVCCFPQGINERERRVAD
jgi:hypothetical protein